LATSRKDYPGLRCVEGDFTDPDLLTSLGKFDILLLVNALHHVFSDSFSAQLGEVDVPVGKQRVQQALTDAVSCLDPGGWVVLFDGLELPGDPNQLVQLCFQDTRALRSFEKFARTYKPFRVTYRKLSSLCVEVAQKYYNRYMTKSIFLEKKLWNSEQFESYQYFTQDEFRSAFTQSGLEIKEIRTLTVNEQKWHQQVDIDASNVKFPDEHILIIAQK
jgi:SAM-dependent methyltransferase